MGGAQCLMKRSEFSDDLQFSGCGSPEHLCDKVSWAEALYDLQPAKHHKGSAFVAVFETKVGIVSDDL